MSWKYHTFLLLPLESLCRDALLCRYFFSSVITVFVVEVTKIINIPSLSQQNAWLSVAETRRALGQAVADSMVSDSTVSEVFNKVKKPFGSSQYTYHI